MLSWVVKVVPQPPDPPPKKVEDQKVEKQTTTTPAAAAAAAPTPPVQQEKKVTFRDECPKGALKADKPEQEAEANSPASGSQSGVLMWLSEALPQPAVSPKLSQANSTTKEEDATTRKGMIAWIAQGLEKVVPQPELKIKVLPPAEPPTEVCPAAAEPAPQVTVVEVESDQEDTKPFPPRMISWIKHSIEKVVPQPEIYIRSKTVGSEKTEAPASAKAEAPAPQPPTDPEKSPQEAEPQPNMIGWIVNEIGRVLPQPVHQQDAGADEVQNISIVQADLVLEDVEEDEDKEAQQEVKEEPQVEANLQLSEKETDDAKTQMDHCTSGMGSFTKEVGEAVLAHMEERLQQERLEAARVAEEMARKAAEEAVRQLEVEHSAKIIIETLPESSEQLPNILEEENEDEPECLVDVCPTGDKTKAATHVEPSPKCEAPEEVTPSSRDVGPVPGRRTLDSPVSQPITKQPGPQPPEVPTTTDQANAAAAQEDGSRVPEICSPIKSFVLRFPHAAECLKSCRKLMHGLYLAPPKLSMPTLLPELAQLAQGLPKQAQQCCTSIASHLRRLNSKSQQSQQP